jgi:dextranase
MDIYPSKAQFSTNETVTLCLICDDVLPISVHIRVLLLSKTVWEQNIVLTENKTTVSIGAFSATFAGYGVNVYQQNDLEKPILQTAFDVAESPRKLLRYGFLSDFTEKDRDNGALEWLLKCHINLVQFYDWSYRHDSLVAPQEDYHDMMGKEISGSTVKAKIAKAKALGISLNRNYAPISVKTEDEFRIAGIVVG